MYHTKLEQLSNLRTRVLALSRTLGPAFFAMDIVEILPAIGEDGTDETAMKDVTPERFSKMEKELVRGKGEIVCDTTMPLFI